MAGRLYIVPTPVGNLEDMTYRAVRVLQEADLILAEDTRTSSVLLHHYGISGKLMSHHKFNEHQTVELIKEKILAGTNVALISDAGTPGISDPGFLGRTDQGKDSRGDECRADQRCRNARHFRSGLPVGAHLRPRRH